VANSSGDRAIHDRDRGDYGETVPASKPQGRPSRSLLLGGAIVFLAVLAVFGVTAFFYPSVPRVLVMAVGPERSAYAAFGERYREILARQGVELTVLHTHGSVENLALLRNSKADIALVQSGLTDPQQSPELVSLGTIGYEPLWIFYRGPQAARSQDQLLGKRVAIGPPGSGTRPLALELAARNGIDESNSKLFSFPHAEAAERLLAGDIDAMIMVAPAEDPTVRKLLTAPDVSLLPVLRANTYAMLYPYLTKVVLPAGYADLAHDRPPTDVPMIATKASLIVRRHVQSAVQYLLMDAAEQIHSRPGAFQKVGEFPAAEGMDVPLSNDARQFYKSGLPFLQRYLPLWLAVLVQQLALTVLPIAAVAYPVFRALPAIYGWGVRRRISMLYGELKLLDLSLENHSRDKRSALSDLARLEHRVTHLRVPSSFEPLLYTLRQDIALVRARLDQPA
jgi:TRAP transporter TAXI family solute receptor